MSLCTDPALLDVTGAVEALPDFRAVGREQQKAAMQLLGRTETGGPEGPPVG